MISGECNTPVIQAGFFLCVSIVVIASPVFVLV